MSRTRRFIFIILALSANGCLTLVSSAAEPAAIRSHIRREPLPSTALATAGYSKKLHILEIEFCNGAIYRYLDVPPAVYRDLLSAESKARYYDWNIKGRYRSLRLRTSEHEPNR
jgi:KTSC domain